MGQPFPSTPSFSLSENEFVYYYFNSGHDQEAKILYKTVRVLISRPLRILESGEITSLILLGRLDTQFQHPSCSWVLRCNDCSSTIATTRNDCKGSAESASPEPICLDVKSSVIFSSGCFVVKAFAFKRLKFQLYLFNECRDLIQESQ